MESRLSRRVYSLCLAAASSIAVVSCGGSATPQPIPTTPGAAAVALTPSSMTFTAAGPASAQVVNASENVNYSGQFTISTAAAGQANSCAGIATASPASGTTFTITPVAAGHCVFTVTGGNGQAATLTIDVTTTTVGGH